MRTVTFLDLPTHHKQPGCWACAGGFHARCARCGIKAHREHRADREYGRIAICPQCQYIYV